METPTPPRHHRFQARRWPIILLVAVLVIAGGVAILRYGGFLQADAAPELQPTPQVTSIAQQAEPTSTPTPSSSPKFDHVFSSEPYGSFLFASTPKKRERTKDKRHNTKNESQRSLVCIA